METGGFLLLLQAAEIIESPPYSDNSLSPTNPDHLETFQTRFQTFKNQMKSVKEGLAQIKSTLMMDCGDMVPIGTGKTMVPKNVYHSLDWSSFTTVTRKLLNAVFCRSVLASHSLTGKPSNAFGDTKPAKRRLNPMKVNDIIMEVTSRCRINKSQVRNVITIKCAEESRRCRLNKSATIQKPKWFL